MADALEVRGLTGLIANVKAFDAAVQREVKTAVRRGAEETVDLAQQLAPYDKGFMHDHIRAEFSEGGYTYRVGLYAEDFAAAGLPFYPVFVEHGTSVSPAQPFLFPAYEAIRPNVEQDVGDALRRSIARARR